MSPVQASRLMPADAATVFGLVTDVRNHARWIPLTRIIGDEDIAAGAPGIGSRFTGRTARFLDDRMEITALAPPEGSAPGRMGVRKHGPVLLGTVEVTVAPIADQVCRLTWSEDVHLAGPLRHRLLDRPTGAVLRAMLVGALSAVEAELTARQAG